MNGLEVGGTGDKEPGTGSVTSAPPVEPGSDFLGVIGREPGFLLPLGGGGRPTGKVVVETGEWKRGLSSWCGLPRVRSSCSSKALRSGDMASDE
jgi:hypothetical protein